MLSGFEDKLGDVHGSDQSNTKYVSLLAHLIGLDGHVPSCRHGRQSSSKKEVGRLNGLAGLGRISCHRHLSKSRTLANGAACDAASR